MHLLIISNMEHFKEGETIWGWGPTVQEINNLATLFDKVTHVGCLHAGPPANSSLPYRASNLHFVGVPPTGGPSLFHKLSILRQAPLYIRKILNELSHADVVHVRCPANIPLLAIMLLAAIRKPKKRWVKYAGNWQPGLPEAKSYRLQRWWLRRNFARALVTVNGDWPNQPSHVHSFYNPCLTADELIDGDKAATAKTMSTPLQLVFVGRVEAPKGAFRLLRIMSALRDAGVSSTLDIIGDGPEREAVQLAANKAGLEDCVIFHGWIRRTSLPKFFREAHLMLLPTSCSEGWPKVLSEAMAYGVVPIAGDVSAIPQYLDQFGVGRAIASEEHGRYVEAIREYVCDANLWKAESKRALMSAHLFSYEEYLDAVCKLLKLSPR